MAVSAGARAIGLVAEMPSGPGPIGDDEITHIVQHCEERYGDCGLVYFAHQPNER